MTRIELISKIKRHPTASFFVFAFLISWTAWFLAPILVPRNTPSFGFISQIGSFGPTLSAVFVAALLNPEPSNASVKKRRVTFAAIFIASLVAQFVERSPSEAILVIKPSCFSLSTP